MLKTERVEIDLGIIKAPSTNKKVFVGRSIIKFEIRRSRCQQRANILTAYIIVLWIPKFIAAINFCLQLFLYPHTQARLVWGGGHQH